MRWFYRVLLLLILLLLSSVVALKWPPLLWIDWLVPILFFGLRNTPLLAAIACAVLMGTVLTLFSIDPMFELVAKSVLVSILIVWLFPLIQWNHPKNALVAWWGGIDDGWVCFRDAAPPSGAWSSRSWAGPRLDAPVGNRNPRISFCGNIVWIRAAWFCQA